MKTTLIDTYLQNLSKAERARLLEIMEYIQSVVENAVVASVFTLPGFTVDFLPICNIRIKGKRITIRFFQKNVFAVFADRMTDIEHGRCSITVNSVDDMKSDAIKELLRLTAVSAKVDAAFTKSIQMRDYGYYDSNLLKTRKSKQEEK